MIWTREHDRILAEKCEGIRVTLGHGVEGTVQYDYYNLDPAAEKRAAEAWRVRKPRRSYVIYSQTGGHPPVVFLIEAGETIGRAEHLHEALYEAVTR